MFPAFGVNTTLTLFQFILLVLATLCIAAGGYIINDIFDVQADAINKPHKLIIGKYIPEDKAYIYYMAFTITGAVLGFYLSHVIDRSTFFCHLCYNSCIIIYLRLFFTTNSISW